MYVLVVSAKVKPEQRGRFLEAIEDNAVRSVRDEPGCLRFDVVVDNDDPHHYLFYEVYRDQDAFAAPPRQRALRPLAPRRRGLPVRAAGGHPHRHGSHPWMTAVNRCLGHVGGTAGEDELGSGVAAR